MEQPRHFSFESRSTNVLLAAIFVALFVASTVRPTGAQSNTSLGTSALTNNTTGTNNTAVGFAALFLNETGNDNTAVGSGVLQSNNFRDNTGIGYEALLDCTTGQRNTAAGAYALMSSTNGSFDTATGSYALNKTTNGSNNTADGYGALSDNTTGGENTAIGFAALTSNGTGSHNIALGYEAGDNLTTGNSNIDISNEGVAGESNTIRIGTKGVHTRAVIAGISGNPVYIGSPVLVNANGRLGIEVSSARYKRDIRDMGGASDRLMKLRPVTFRYKEDPKGTLQYGLVAEEVAHVYPELVTYGDDGKPQSVAYHLLPAMLLNEMQKQIRENERQAEQIGRLTTRIAGAEANARKKDLQIAILVSQIGTLRKQATQIDSLTARLTALENQSRPERVAAAMR